MLPGLGLVLWLVSGFSTGHTYGAHTTAFVKTHSAHILQLRVFSCVNQNSLWVNKDLLYCTLFSLNYSNHLLLINVTLMNVRLIQVIKYSSDSPKDTQPHKPDHSEMCLFIHAHFSWFLNYGVCWCWQVHLTLLKSLNHTQLSLYRAS